MGGSKDQKSTTKTEPWSGQQPYLKDLFAQAQGLYNQGPQQYYPGQTVAPFSPQTMLGMDMMTGRILGGSSQMDAFGNYLNRQLGQQNIDPSIMAGYGQQAAGGIGMGMNAMDAAAMGAAGMGQPNQMVGGAANALGGMTGYGGLGEAGQYAGSPTLGALPASQQYAVNQMGTGAAGNQQLAGTAGGQFLGSNPYLDQMFATASGRAGEAFNEQTMPAIAAQFGGAGRTGSGIHQEMGENAMRQFGRDLQGMAADIYAPAYESERNRMIQAAQGASGAGLGAANLGLGTFAGYNQADMARRGLGADLYLGERGLGQQAATGLGQLGIGQGNLQLGGYNTLLGAGQGMGQLGMGGLGQMNDLYGNIAQNQFRAGSLAPSYNDMQYGDMQRMIGLGGMMEDQTQRLMDSNYNRFMYEQGAPWQSLQNYANVVYGSPSFGTTTQRTPGGSRLGGMIGGGLAGWGATGNPWGAVIGGLGGLL